MFDVKAYFKNGCSSLNDENVKAIRQLRDNIAKELSNNYGDNGYRCRSAISELLKDYLIDRFEIDTIEQVESYYDDNSYGNFGYNYIFSSGDNLQVLDSDIQIAMIKKAHVMVELRNDKIDASIVLSELLSPLCMCINPKKVVTV